jgi:sporulation protein YlmC with PRC-barrel domain
MSSAQMESDTIDVRGGEMIHLVRDVLDKMMVDLRHDPMGRVDGIVLKILEGEPPRVMCIESGIVVAASRVGRWMGRWARWAARRWGLSGGRPVRIGWDCVVRGGVEVKLDLDAEKTRALAWEHWLLAHIVRFVPSLKKAQDESSQSAGGGGGSSRWPAKPQAADVQKVRGRRIRLQRLLGRKVVDTDGRVAGRIEEVRAHVRDGVCVVESFEVGRKGLLERLSIGDVSLAMVRVLGARRGAGARGHRVPWQQLDLSDPEHPRLRCGVTELLSSAD